MHPLFNAMFCLHHNRFQAMVACPAWHCMCCLHSSAATCRRIRCLELHLKLCWVDIVAEIEGHKLQFLNCCHPVKTAALGKATLSPYTCS
jgi:hypothetical protein